MTRRPAEYHAYLLRLWNASPGGLPAWHASLEDPQAGERQGFADLEQLYTFLVAQTAAVPMTRTRRPWTADGVQHLNTVFTMSIVNQPLT